VRVLESQVEGVVDTLIWMVHRLGKQSPSLFDSLFFHISLLLFENFLSLAFPLNLLPLPYLFLFFFVLNFLAFPSSFVFDSQFFFFLFVFLLLLALGFYFYSLNKFSSFSCLAVGTNPTSHLVNETLLYAPGMETRFAFRALDIEHAMALALAADTQAASVLHELLFVFAHLVWTEHIAKLLCLGWLTL
jgi:hypothetical protein